MFSACQQTKSNLSFRNRQFVIDGENIKITKFLAEGSFARIYKTSNKNIVVKHSLIQSQEQLQAAKKECRMLFLLRNAHNCLHVRGVYFDDQPSDEVPAIFDEVFIFMDFCDTQLA